MSVVALLVLVVLFLVLVGNPKKKCVCGCPVCAGCPFSLFWLVIQKKNVSVVVLFVLVVLFLVLVVLFLVLVGNPKEKKCVCGCPFPCPGW